MQVFLRNSILITLLLVLGIGTVHAETDNDIVLQAMRLEVERSKTGLQKDSLARPFFISLFVNETNFDYTYTTSFGEQNNEVTDTRISRRGNPLVLVGSYHRTQNFNSHSNGFQLPAADDENAIRTAIWMSLDNAYKNAAKNYVEKMAWLKQEKQTEEELALHDFEKREPVTLLENERDENLDFLEAKEVSLKISKLLAQEVKKEKVLVEDMRTRFNFSKELNRYYDTEGSTYKYPSQAGTFNISLTGVNEEGEDIGAYRNFRMNELSKFPSTAELEKAVTAVVAEYKIKYSTKKDDEPYMGPLLVVDGQVEELVRQVVNSLYTSPKTRYSNGNHYQNLLGARILSKQLSLSVDYGKDAQKLAGVKRDFAPIDRQAVIPPDSLTLIQNGMLRNMLASRQPVKKIQHSNGNAKMGNNVEGVITFTGNETYSYEEIKKLLLEEAKLQGLEYAYIISNEGKLHRKVNVETGEEIPFAASINLGQTMKTMRRVMGVEDKQIASADGTIRYPKSILLEDAEITVYKSNSRLKKNFVERPKF